MEPMSVNPGEGYRLGFATKSEDGTVIPAGRVVYVLGITDLDPQGTLPRCEVITSDDRHLAWVREVDLCPARAPERGPSSARGLIEEYPG